MKKTFCLFALSIILISTLLFSCGGGGGGGVDNAMEDTSFSIGYNANGAESGTAPTAQSGNGKEVLSVSANTGSLAKGGYLFDGWNTSADGSGADYAPGALYNGKNITLYAKWAAIFNVQVITAVSPSPSLDGAQGAPGISYLKIIGLTAKGRTLSNIVIPEAIDGYQVNSIGARAFQGCDTVTDFSIPETVTSIEDNAFAGCTGINTLTIPRSVTSIGNGTFSGCGGLSSLILLNPIPPTMGTDAMEGCTATVSVPAAGVDAYKTAEGWDTYSASIAGYSTEIYTVIFEDQGATTAPSFTRKEIIPPAVTIGQLPTPPKRTGYNFGGWFKEQLGTGGEFTASTVVSSNITVYAKWNEYSYTVRFNDQNATTPVGDTTKTVSSPNTTVGTLPTEPANVGYYFGGWNTKSDGTGTVFNANTPVTGDISVYAIWINNPTRTVTFNSQGADIRDVAPPSKQVISPAVTVDELPSPPEKTGYSFGGWFSAPEGAGNEFTASSLVTEDIIVYAKWLKKYTISFDDNGATSGSVPSDFEGVSGEQLIIEKGNLKKTDFVILGWNTQKDGSGITYVDGEKYIINGDAILYAKWVPLLTINNASGGMVSADKTNNITIGTTITLSLTLDPGYTLASLDITGGVKIKTLVNASGYTLIVNNCDSEITITPKFSAGLSYLSNINNLAVGDVVLANGKYIAYGNFVNNASSYLNTSAAAGIVAYIGETGTAGITGKAYMLGLNQENSLMWAPPDTFGYNTTFSTSDTAGEDNWLIIKATDEEGSSNASTNYPAFNYANTYSTIGYTGGWFLPSKEELNKLYSNKTLINESIRAITKAGGTATALPYSLGSVWSSSQCPSIGHYALFYDLLKLSMSKNSKNCSYIVRVIHSLDN